jgi:tripartite-type tricarboxylate transporter receptor subunit TctC
MRLAIPLCALLCIACGGVASAADYPSKPIRLVVGFPPGGATDLVARIIQPRMSAALGHQVVIDTRAGANGIIAGELTARADPDGYTILFGHIGMLIISPAIQKVPYDTFKDLAPIGQMVSLQNFIIAHPAVPVKTLRDLIALAKAKPDQLNYATSGIGSPGHLAAVLLESMAKIKLAHIPYKGEPAGVTDLVSNRVQLMIATYTTAGPHVKDGKLRVLATTLPRRSPVFPDAPTMAEAGMPQFSIVSWAGLFAPAKTPKDVVDRLNREFVAAMKRPEVVAAMDKQAFPMTPSTPEQLGAFVKEQKEAYTRILRAAGVQPE